MSARQVASESSEDEYFSVGAHAYGGADTSDSDADTAETTSMAPPRHPVSAMQGAFEESIYESSDPDPQPRSKDNTAEARRQRVLESRHYDDSWTMRWKQKPGARHHPLAKLMAQIVFGMHLLQQQAAKSDEEVVRILQTHVDEVDNFLERTTEDFDLATKDIAERIHFLRLPMSHPDVFGGMLEEKQFRTQLMEGNEKIEAIIERTSRAMNASLLDMSRAKSATKELGRYLNAVSDEWPGEKQDLEAVFNAMRGNEQGWKHCLRELQVKAHELRDNLDKLSAVIGEMARMAEAASRRTRAHGRAVSAGQPPMSSIPRSKFSNDGQRSRAMSVDKPLPDRPINTNGPVELEAHPVPLSRRYEQPRALSATHPRGPRSSTVPPRPMTARSAMTPREARDLGRDNTRDIVEFLREARAYSPLKSNPPDGPAGQAWNAGHNKRQSAIDVVEHARTLGNTSRPPTSDGKGALPLHRRGSEPARMEPRSREGIERNKYGPPPSGSGRRDSSIGPRFMRRLSFRSSSKTRAPQSPPPTRSSAPQIPPVGAIDQSSDQRANTPTLNPPITTSTKRTTSPTLAPPITQRKTSSEHPSTPSVASNSGRSTNHSPSLTVTTPGTENLSPATKPDSTEKTASPSQSKPKLANGNANGNGNVNGTNTTNGNKANPPLAQTKVTPSSPPEEKKRGRGLSIRRFFGSSSNSGTKMTKERIPRAAMTYGDLA